MMSSKNLWAQSRRLLPTLTTTHCIVKSLLPSQTTRIGMIPCTQIAKGQAWRNLFKY